MQGLAGTKESVYGNLMKQELLTADKKISCAMWDLAANGALTYALMHLQLVPKAIKLALHGQMASRWAHDRQMCLGGIRELPHLWG
jgi:hypothetical protein